MATEALKSAALTNADATPPVFNSARLVNGMVRRAVAKVESTAKDAASTYRMVRVPSNAFGFKIEFASDDLGTTGTVDVGVYQTPDNGGAVVDADFFASALDVKTAAVALTDVTHESGAYDIDDVEKPLWEALGLTADPQRDYDIVITSVEAINTGGTMALKVSWAV